MKQPRLVFGLTVPFSTILLGDLLSKLIDDGWDVHLILGEGIPPALAVDSRVQVHVVPMERRIGPINDLRALARWIRLLREIRPDVCVGATPKAALLAMMASRIDGVPNRIFQVWGAKWDGAEGVRGVILRWADRLAVWSSTETVACSQSLADLLVSQGVSKKAPKVLEFGGTKGVDLEKFSPRQVVYGKLQKSAMIGFVGRIAKDKGMDSLIRVFQAVRNELPEVQLTVVGPIDETDPISTWSRDVLESTTEIVVAGHQADIASFMKRFDVLCFPSVREGLPNVVIEAAASGVPVVAWDVTGTRDAIEHNLTGFLIPPFDEGEMACRIVRLLRDDELRQSFSSEARSFAEERFDSRRVVQNQIDFFNQLVGRGIC